jgi:hypothetical protein
LGVITSSLRSNGPNGSSFRSSTPNPCITCTLMLDQCFTLKKETYTANQATTISTPTSFFVSNNFCYYRLTTFFF